MREDKRAARAQALEDAAHWHIRLGDADLADADVDAWNAWMAASPLHARAFADIDLLWEASADVDSARVDAERARREHAEHAHAHAQQRQAGTADAARVATTQVVTGASFRPRASVRQPTRRRARRLVAWAAVAAGVSACALAVGLWWPPASPVPPSELHLVAAAGVPRQAMLEDGSRIDLDAGSEVVVQYGARRRQVELVRGQAYFSVARDAARPFEVRAGGALAQALGTRFLVARREEGERVAVTEGRVQVADVRVGDGSPRHVVQLAANESTTLLAAGALMPPSRHQTAQTLAWLDGNVTYRRETLGNVVADLNRHSARPILLDDATLATLPVTGRWRTGDLDAWLDSVARALALRVERDGTRIVLSRGMAQPPPVEAQQ